MSCRKFSIPLSASHQPELIALSVSYARDTIAVAKCNACTRATPRFATVVTDDVLRKTGFLHNSSRFRVRIFVFPRRNEKN